MDHYVTIMNILSTFGFFILIASLYLIVFGISKLNYISLFAIHGHELSVGICQLCMTLGVVPTFEFPCAAGYTNGLFNRLGFMSTLAQAFIQILLLVVAGWFVALISIIRVFAVSIKLQEKTKKIILYSHMLHLSTQLLLFVYIMIQITNSEEEGLRDCLKMKDNKISPEMYTQHAFFILIGKHKIVYFLYFDILFIASVFAGIAGVCGIELIQSLRKQKAASKSPKASKIQRHLTFAILGLIATNVIGIALPSTCIMLCASLNLGSPIYSQISFVIMSIYPFFGCLFVWMATPTFRTKLMRITVLPNCILSKDTIRIHILRSKPTSQNLTNHFMNNAAMPSAITRNQALPG
ncbi:unnamed protein product [Auanema sp. JU1783]|nr:unnamed protein product [Auanema sp. JU1783]